MVQGNDPGPETPAGSGRVEESGRFEERYTDLRPVGRGTSATVHRAWSPHFARDVAVKVFLGGAPDADVRRRFTRECQVVGTLADHPHVVSVFDSGFTAEGAPYLVMTYCAGGSFGQRLAGQGPRPAAEVAAVGIAVADALAAAHGLGIVHRDVKPQNVLLTGYGVVALADFGVASGPLSDLRSFAATPGYVAPEVVAGPGPGGPPADLYALGATLYALLTGGPPHRPRVDEPELDYLVRAAEERVPALPPMVPPALARVIHTCLETDPADRPADAAAVRRLLRLAVAEDRLEVPERLDVLPIPAAPPDVATPPSVPVDGTSPSPSPWPRRVAAACLAGALLAGGTAGGLRLAAGGDAGTDAVITVPGPSGVVTVTVPPAAGGAEPGGTGGTGGTGGAAGSRDAASTPAGDAAGGAGPGATVPATDATTAPVGATTAPVPTTPATTQTPVTDPAQTGKEKKPKKPKPSKTKGGADGS